MKPKLRNPEAGADAEAVGVNGGNAQSALKRRATFLKALKLQARKHLKPLLQRWQAQESKRQKPHRRKRQKPLSPWLFRSLLRQ